MKSHLGRNSRFCAIRFGLLSSDVGMYKWEKNCFDKYFVSHLPVGDARFVYEVIAIRPREGWLMLGNHEFSRGEMDEIISFMVT